MAHISTAHNPSKTAKKRLRRKAHRSKKKKSRRPGSTWVDLGRLGST